MIVVRRECSGELFNAFSVKPRFHDVLLMYLAESYGEIRKEEGA